MALPQEAVAQLRATVDEVQSAVGRTISLTDASQFPIGRTTLSGRTGWSAYILQIGACSASLTAFGVKKRTHNDDYSGLMIRCVESVLSVRHSAAAALLGHWFNGYLGTETVAARREVIIKMEDLVQAIEHFEEDVRYVIVRG